MRGTAAHQAWRAAGFAVEVGHGSTAAEIGVCTLGGVRFHLVGSATPGVHSWTIESAGAPASELEINGLRCLVRPEGAGGPPAPPSAHPNGATALNKAVILCADTPDTAAKLPIGEPLVLKTNPAPPENDGTVPSPSARRGD